MKQPILFVALLLTVATIALAQDNSECRIRVLPIQYDWQDNGEIQRGHLSDNQADWWKDNAKKFPGVCFVTQKPADYVLAWTQNSVSVPYTTTVPVTTASSGTVTTSDGRTATYSGTTTTNQIQQQEWNHWFVNAKLFKVAADKLQQPEVFRTKQHGRWRWSKPDKDAFEQAIKSLPKSPK